MKIKMISIKVLFIVGAVILAVVIDMVVFFIKRKKNKNTKNYEKLRKNPHRFTFVVENFIKDEGCVDTSVFGHVFGEVYKDDYVYIVHPDAQKENIIITYPIRILKIINASSQNGAQNENPNEIQNEESKEIELEFARDQNVRLDFNVTTGDFVLDDKSVITSIDPKTEDSVADAFKRLKELRNS